ncbi:MAG: hypothetical protein WCV99_24870 [Sterolibacterium sp.]
MRRLYSPTAFEEGRVCRHAGGEFEAYQRGFPGAARKAFVADGSDANWGVWRRHFSDYVPILDFIHAPTYVYAAAMAGHALKEGWRAYRAWA